MLISPKFFVGTFIVFKASLFISLLLHTQSAFALPMQDPNECGGRHNSFLPDCDHGAGGNELEQANQWRRNKLNQLDARMRARCLRMTNASARQRCFEMVPNIDT